MNSHFTSVDICSLFVLATTKLHFVPARQMFGPNKRVELCILIFLVIFWLVTIWFNTTIRGIAGEGNEQYNLYFTSWLCLWTTFWTLERWFVASGMSSFQKFISSWPNRCKLWLITFIVSFADFLFVLDAVSVWLAVSFFLTRLFLTQLMFPNHLSTSLSQDEKLG